MQIRFTFETEFGPFSDALYLSDDHTLTDAELDALKQARLANWLVALTEPAVEAYVPVEETPPVEDAAPDSQVG